MSKVFKPRPEYYTKEPLTNVLVNDKHEFNFKLWRFNKVRSIVLLNKNAWRVAFHSDKINMGML